MRRCYHVGVGAIRSFDDAVRDYITRFRGRKRREERWFAIQGSLEDAIERAAMAVSPAGKRLSHQRRIPKAVLRAWTGALLKRRADIRHAKTFGELHDILSEVGAELHGIGRLTVYDTSTRIGAFLKLEADRVYLHAGTRDGARALGLIQRDSLLPSDLPKAFRRLSSGEIEDCLCIYKREIATIARGSRPTSGPRGCGASARTVRGC
jgi:hypothetical protein